MARIARNGWSAGTRASQLTYENRPSVCRSSPRIARLRSRPLAGSENHDRRLRDTAFFRSLLDGTIARVLEIVGACVGGELIEEGADRGPERVLGPCRRLSEERFELGKEL